MYKSVKCMVCNDCYIFEYLEELDVDKCQKFGDLNLDNDFEIRNLFLNIFNL